MRSPINQEDVVTQSQQYDAIVIGAGRAGVPLATALAGAGKRSAIIEADQVGGCCVNYGCTPTKTMVASARVAQLARRAGDYGVKTGGFSVDIRRVIARKQAIVDRWRSGSERRIDNAQGLELIRGKARFVGPKALAI